MKILKILFLYKSVQNNVKLHLFYVKVCKVLEVFEINVVNIKQSVGLSGDFANKLKYGEEMEFFLCCKFDMLKINVMS